MESKPPETATRTVWPRGRSCRERRVRSTASTKSLIRPCYWLRQMRQADLSSDHFQRLEFPSENRPAGGFEPLLQDGGVNRAEIDRIFQVSVQQLVRRQTRICSEQAGFDFAASDEHGRGGAVIGARVCVFRHAPAEFTEGHHHHTIEVALGFEVFNKCFNGVA